MGTHSGGNTPVRRGDTAGRPRRPPSKPSDRRRFTPQLALAVVMATLILACGASPVLLNKAPASQLQLWLTFAYEPPLPTESLPPGKIIVTAEFQTARQGRVGLVGSQDLTCDGVDVLEPATAATTIYGSVLLNRRPPGGKYTCVYTDERGHHTTVVIPVPAHDHSPTCRSACPHPAIPPQAFTHHPAAHLRSDSAAHAP